MYFRNPNYFGSRSPIQEGRDVEKSILGAVPWQRLPEIFRSARHQNPEAEEAPKPLSTQEIKDLINKLKQLHLPLEVFPTLLIETIQKNWQEWMKEEKSRPETEIKEAKFIPCVDTQLDDLGIDAIVEFLPADETQEPIRIGLDITSNPGKCQ